MIRPEADDAGAPHLRLLAGNLLHQLQHGESVPALPLVRDLPEKLLDARIVLFGLQLRHLSLLLTMKRLGRLETTLLPIPQGCARDSIRRSGTSQIIATVT